MGKMASNTPRTQLWLCGFAWPAAGVQASADVRGSEALGPCASSLRGSCSLTQVTFQPFPLPSFSAFPSNSAMLGIGEGGQGGRGVPPSQGSLGS